MITGANYIGNVLSKKGDKQFSTFNPKENKVTEWIFYEANTKEIDEAVNLAEKSFITYSAYSGKRKANFLRTIADEIMNLGPQLIDTYTKESGLPEGRAVGERGRTVGQLKAFADLLEEGSWIDANIDTAQPLREPLPKADIRKLLVPLGPIVVFGSSNFPFAFSTAGGDTASALAAGCPVIVKSHPMHAGTGELVASAVIKAAQKTGMPNGIFSNLNSSGIEVGQQLVRHPKVKGVGFTGSIKGGTALYKMAAEREEPIPVFAEMGSINPVIAFKSELSKNGANWAKQYAGSIMLGAGQFCTSPGLILGIKSTYLDEFTKFLGEEILQLEPTCMLHPNIHESFEMGKNSLSAQEGSNIVADYKNNVAKNYAQQKILAVSGQDFLKNTKLHQEVFGPFAIVVSCQDIDELKTIVAGLEGQLTGTILGSVEELEQYGEIVRALTNRVGRIIFNGVPTGVEVCPSMLHGGPFPASSDSRFSSVGTSAIKRWVRPVSYQDWPNELLPDALRDENPLGIMRLVDGEYSRTSINDLDL